MSPCFSIKIQDLYIEKSLKIQKCNVAMSKKVTPDLEPHQNVMASSPTLTTSLLQVSWKSVI